jgi:capsular polysaccharide biosynthesis protein
MPEQNNTQQPCHEDEIDLREIINVILKRKKLILGIFLASVIITAIVSFVIPKTYLSTAIIQTGIVSEPLISTEEAAQMIKTNDFLTPIIKELELTAKPESLKNAINLEKIKDTNLNKLELKYQDKATSYRLCKQIADSFSARANELYKQRIDLAQSYKEVLDMQLNTINRSAQDMQTMVRDTVVLEGADETQTVIMHILLKDLLLNQQTNVAKLIENKDAINKIISSSKEFKTIDIENPKKIAPNIKLNIVLAGTFSLMFGIFLAFFLEFWQKSS